MKKKIFFVLEILLCCAFLVACAKGNKSEATTSTESEKNCLEMVVVFVN